MRNKKSQDVQSSTAPFSLWRFLGGLALRLLLVFALGKVLFMLYNYSHEPFSLRDLLEVWVHGLTMDLSTVGYLLVLPWLFGMLTLAWPRFPLRRVLIIYYLILSILLALIIGGDTVLYPFWKFKLNAVVFSYLSHPEGAVSSVSMFFLLGCCLGFLLFCGVIFWILKGAAFQLSGRSSLASFLFSFLLAPVIFLAIRGGVNTSVMNLGVPYYSPRLFLNHAAVNPAFSLFASISKSGDFSTQFDYFREDERAQIFQGLYPEETQDITDTLLITSRPNVLVVLMESYGSKFIRELGGEPDVSPHLSRLIPQGIFWENYYSNSFRTDRGIVSTFSGWISYPTASLMRLPEKLGSVPSLAQSLAHEGYLTHYFYGGDIKIMGERGYLIQTGYQTLTSAADFSLAEAHESKWGVNDSITALRALQLMREMPADRPWHLVWQTLSSHEPFEVPYHRLQNPILNAFAFTDRCVGQLMDSLQASPLWDNLLVILVPDHGFLYNLTYQDPEFFHSPMLWLGGAVRSPRRMKVLMNQSDLCATLLSQMGIPHDRFVWSRNVLSRHYTYPFVYSNYPGGILFRDSTGVSVYDITADELITERPTPSDERLRRGKAILQTSYDRLGEKSTGLGEKSE